ncbi:FAD-dependent monooxygenase [Streptomyces actinomycinicus]|uniref:FAD-dependent monooxygenase n=1 Tax=Streptomyces actinomycinicus TaxID=1695166 RepID=A0A937EM56_9ACTN|nr:FAD-dependent monooxygenase [Streptomyces actinomycinicus]MBL1084983.1 FAD-dependent monooxygenase [Streptomyces actinomycinicus]
MTAERPWGRAVVVGGSYAGLVTARVLADFFGEVVLVERDAVDEDTGTHPGAPQGHHAHAMLARGGEILERLFPGLREELRQAGAPVFDYGEDVDFLLPAGFAPRKRTGIRIQSFTRDELERRLRRKVLARPEITLRASTRCTGLTRDPAGRVSGVTCARQGTDEPFEVTADLVVDASGRSSALGDWLGAMGIAVPPKRTVKAKVTYTSMKFDRPGDGHPDHPDYYVAYQMPFAPQVSRAGVLLAVEGNRWTCSLFGFEEQPPTDDEGYLAYAESLGNPRLARHIARRTVQEPTHRYTNVENRWRLYHKVRDWPDGLIAVGDSVCVFNPVYGQGLTVAAMEAELLHGMLAGRRAAGKSPAGLAGDFQKRLGRLLLAPWTLSTNADLMWSPEHAPPAARFAHWYNAHLFRAAVRDAAVWSRFARVVNMVASPAVLFHPAVALKVLAAAFAARGKGSEGA